MNPLSRIFIVLFEYPDTDQSNINCRGCFRMFAKTCVNTVLFLGGGGGHLGCAILN